MAKPRFGTSTTKASFSSRGKRTATGWSFTTLAVAAKNVMVSVPDYVLLETAFTILQFVVVGPLIALAHRR